jgi:hypothetical protein
LTSHALETPAAGGYSRDGESVPPCALRCAFRNAIELDCGDPRAVPIQPVAAGEAVPAEERSPAPRGAPKLDTEFDEPAFNLRGHL